MSTQSSASTTSTPSPPPTLIRIRTRKVYLLPLKKMADEFKLLVPLHVYDLLSSWDYTCTLLIKRQSELEQRRSSVEITRHNRHSLGPLSEYVRRALEHAETRLQVIDHNFDRNVRYNPDVEMLVARLERVSPRVDEEARRWVAVVVKKVELALGGLRAVQQELEGMESILQRLERGGRVSEL